MSKKTIFILWFCLCVGAASPAVAQVVDETVSKDTGKMPIINIELEPDFQLLFPKRDTLSLILNTPPYEWLSYQMKISMQTSEQPLAFQCFFVNRSDSLLYFNLHKSGIELARAVVTRDSVVFVDKINKQYYRGGHEFFLKLFGFPADYDMLEALMTARDFRHFEQNFTRVEENDRLLFISPSRAKLDSSCILMQQIEIAEDGTGYFLQKNDMTDLASMRGVTIQYNQYHPVVADAPYGEETDNKEWLLFSEFLLNLPTEDTTIQAEIKNIHINKPGPTSIKIPDSFTPIE